MDRTFLRNASIGATSGYFAFLLINVGIESFLENQLGGDRFVSAALALAYIPLVLSRSIRTQLDSEQILNGLLAWGLILIGTVVSVWIGTRPRSKSGSGPVAGD